MIYTVNRSIIIGENGEVFTAYGIEAWENGEKIAFSEPDIFFNREEAVAFAKRCNDLGLAPEHLQDVIEDILCE